MTPLLLLLLLASPLLAENADLALTLTAPESVEPNVSHNVIAVAENLGPDAAIDVKFRLDYGSCANSITIPLLAAGHRHTLVCEQTFPPTRPVASASAQAYSKTNDPVSNNNGASALVRVNTPPILVAYAFANTTIDPGLPFVLNATVMNTAYASARDVVLTLQIDGIAGWGKLPSSCVAAGAQVRCALGDLRGRNSINDVPSIHLDVEAIAPDDPSGRTLIVDAYASDAVAGDAPIHSNTARLYRSFYVTTTSDSGPGSLREAIAATTRERCTWALKCKVAFRIAGAGAQWSTIRPESPLPLIRETVVDGRMQGRFFGDTNPDGPEIELNGARAQAPMAGLEIESGQLYGITINGFGGPGVFVRGGALIYDSYIGCDPTGTRVVGNERGVVIENPSGTLGVANCVISGNRRAGIFAYSAHDVAIASNRIGWNAKLDGALPNGASGVFMGPGVEGGSVSHNSIAFNAHAGIAVSKGVRLVEMTRNALHANLGLAIDYGLDGVSPSVEGPSKIFESPRITSARYDPLTDTTVIEGFQPGPRDGFATRSITLYSNDLPDPSGFGEGQYVLGEFPFATFSSPDNPPFRVTVPGRPPGKWISATVTVGLHYYWSRTPRGDGNNQGLLTTTTEFGATVPVEGF